MPHQILDDFYFVERGFLNGNHFVYRAGRPILVDTGHVLDFAETERLVASLDVDLSSVSLIVNTHVHCDHIGGNKLIQERSGCDTALHKVGKHFIDTRDDWATWWRYFDQDADFFTCTRSLEDGEIVAIGPHEFQVIYTPGHSSDGIVLYNRKEKVLLSSDTLWGEDMPVVTVRVEGSRAPFSFYESLEKLEALDVRMVFPGHGKPFTDTRAAISKSKKRLQGYLQDRERIGTDVLKKITVYTLLMRRQVDEDSFFSRLLDTPWFKETVDLYFNCDYRAKYDEIMGDFLSRGIVKCKDGRLFTTVKP